MFFQSHTKTWSLDYRHAHSCVSTFKKAMLSEREHPQGVWRTLCIAFFIVLSVAMALRTIDTHLQGMQQALFKSVDMAKPNVFVSPVYAAENAPYVASLLLRPRGAIRAEAGSTATVQLGFKNIGMTTWRNEQEAYISLYNRDYKAHKSIFAYRDWLNSDHTARMTPAVVAPGEMGFISFVIAIPDTIGTYKDTFQLAAENTAWVAGGLY